MDLCNPKEIKALLGRHGFHFSKSKGQNFLIQSWVPQQAAEASGAAPGVGVLEIGPGIGPLTAQLAQRGEKVAAVELDATLLPILAETMAPYPNVEIVAENQILYDQMLTIKSRIRATLAKCLKNGSLQVSIRLAKQDEIKPLLSPKETLDQLVKENTAVGRLVQSLSLDLA